MNSLKLILARSSQATAITVILLLGVMSASWILSIKPGVSAADGHSHDEHDEHSDHDDHEDHAEHNDHSDHTENHEHDEGRHVILNSVQLAKAKIKIEEARSLNLSEKLVLNGLIVPNQEQLVHVVPRFPGLIQTIDKSVGQSVEQGDVLARIESNQSLQIYEITSPISGTVLERPAALGEFADEGDRLMVIADLSTVWIDFRVHQRDFERLRKSQAVRIQSVNGQQLATSEISYISPFGASDTQTMKVRAVTENTNGQLRPGLFVTGEVDIIQREVAVAVRQRAIQYLEGEPVVFVDVGGEFVAVDVELGTSGGDYVEIISGLQPGDRYAADNSFILKAELGKGLAAHEH